MNHDFAYSLARKNLIVVVKENESQKESEWFSACREYHQTDTIIAYLSPNFRTFEYKIENGPIIKSPHSFLSSLMFFPDFSNLRCHSKILRTRPAWASIHHKNYQHFLQDFDTVKALKTGAGIIQTRIRPDKVVTPGSYLKVPAIDAIILTDISMLIRFFTFFETFENLFTAGVNLMNCSEFQIEHEYV